MALTNIVLLKYNNYYNRIIKKFDDLESYTTYPGNLIYTNVNFYPADGVNTEIVLNSNGLTHGPITKYLLSSPNEADYLVEYGDDENILSRWFIIEAEQTRNGQYRLTLHRDVIADNYNKIIDSPVYVEKATVGNIEDVAIYNNEDIGFNSIKKSEYLLKEKENIPAWIVGYMAPNTPNTTITIGNRTIKPDYTASTFSDWEFNQYRTEDFKQVYDLNLRYIISAYKRYGIFNAYKGYQNCIFNDINGYEVGTVPYAGYYDDPQTAVYISELDADINPYYNTYVNNLSTFKNIFYTYNTDLKYGFNIQTLNNKVLYISTGTDIGYYNISVVKGAHHDDDNYESIDVTSNITTEINNQMKILRSDLATNSSPSKGSLAYKLSYDAYRINLTKIDEGLLNFTIPASSQPLMDAPYKMFCIPYGESTAAIVGTTRTFGSKQIALDAAVAIARELGGSPESSSYIYDIQLLPYLPWQEKISSHGIIMIPNNDNYRSLIKDNDGNTVSYILFPPYSTFSFDINNIELSLPNNVVDRKIIGQCDKYRLCSPNYSSVFEFNLLKTGSIKKFNVDCTYKPYSPYIHINPVWGKLYGGDFDDTRGLILQGDFSLPIINDQWQQYQINNKNYLNAFNREIQTIELNNKYQRLGDITSAITGTGAGVGAGAMIGGVPGAIVGGLSSAAGGVLDIAIKEKLRMDALDLKKDQFNYSLDNIKALPNTLARVSSFDANNKIFPILEFYTCTDQEKEILKNKMKYNGMTIMRIDKIKNFILPETSYIKGKLIRLESIYDDFHMINSVADELNKGVFL